jgi:hypothetical protein
MTKGTDLVLQTIIADSRLFWNLQKEFVQIPLQLVLIDSNNIRLLHDMAFKSANMRPYYIGARAAGLNLSK